MLLPITCVARGVKPVGAVLRRGGWRIGRRQLGDSVQGPQLWDLAENWRKAKEFFTKPALSYGEYKQQCVSLRLFVFGGVCGGCVLSLATFPPKSSYWITWGPTYWFSHVKRCFGTSPSLFLTTKGGDGNAERQNAAEMLRSGTPPPERSAPSSGEEVAEEHHELLMFTGSLLEYPGLEAGIIS
eukprot:symbB.v1.2.039706.t1/scaffold6737.1/size15877/1